MKAISVQNINKSYGSLHALKNINFEVEQGKIYGLIGPDGAGKTTLFRILATLILADEGNATVDNLDVVKDYKKIRTRIGYMPGKFSLYQDLSIEENLSFFATIFGTTIEENYHLIKDIYQQIEPFKKRKAGKLSGGMKQKLALCCALIHKPSVLFLDEPTTGVDPVSRKELWEMLKKLKNAGITILVSTPYMDEAGLCDEIAFIHEGEILEISTPERMVEKFDKILWSVKSTNMYKLLLDLRKMPNVETSFTFGETLHITVNNNISISQLKEALEQKDHKNVVISEIKATIEDCYMQML